MQRIILLKENLKVDVKGKDVVYRYKDWEQRLDVSQIYREKDEEDERNMDSIWDRFYRNIFYQYYVPGFDNYNPIAIYSNHFYSNCTNTFYMPLYYDSHC
jgi:hypothetical protein